MAFLWDTSARCNLEEGRWWINNSSTETELDVEAPTPLDFVDKLLLGINITNDLTWRYLISVITS